MTAQQLAERNGLVALYEATDGPNWKNNTNWLSDKPLDEWYGVATNKDGSVIQLELSNNRLAGIIPPQVGNLLKLEYLDLNDNLLTGEIQSHLGNLSNLKTLSLNNNQLSGEIPARLVNLSSLEFLALKDNLFTGGISIWLSYMPNLRILYLSGNQLSGCVPESLQNQVLRDLSALNLPKCRQTQTIQELTDREVLVALYLVTNGPNWKNNTNWLTDKPLNSWYGITVDTNGRVTVISLRDNQLAGEIPAELGNLTGLTSLVLYANQLVGTIPPKLTELSSLRELYLGGTIFSGSQLGGCVPLSLFGVAYNDLSRLRLPICEPLHIILASERDVLVALYEATNGPNWTNSANWLSDKPLGEWYGVITDAIGRVTKLQLSENGLSGKLPIELGNLHNLEGYICWWKQTARMCTHLALKRGQ